MRVQATAMLAASNEFNGTSASLNSSTMEEGNGDDAAVKVNNYNVWDEAW
ncbi:MAG: hypothetical protein IJQ59_02005 [Bacteroidaceae bacterium]|nr:hypothetical protein [Bacteroidaceae bacterium]